MTQDTSPPGSIFKAGLLRKECDPQDQTMRFSGGSRALDEIFPMPLFFRAVDRPAVEYSSFENRSRGGVLSCVAFGSAPEDV